MILYKNVDICDLEPIAKNGILSIDECGNNNWDEGKRAENDTSVVYLFNDSSKRRDITIEELKYLLEKYEELDELVRKITTETNIRY